MKYRISKVSFFPKQASINPVMHLPVTWEVEVFDEIKHGGQQVKISFCDHNKVELEQGPCEARLNSGGNNLAFDVHFGEMTVKLYSEVLVPDGFWGKSN